MESILEFMYLGVATFYQDRINEFLNVAKSLEIKDISKDMEFNKENMRNVEPEISVNENDTEVETEPQTNSSNDRNTDYAKSTQLMDLSGLQMTSEGMFQCNQCESKFKQKTNLTVHIRSIHEGDKYACNHCDHKATQQSNLKTHIRSKHKGVMYACHQCKYQALHYSGLRYHIKSVHEGLKYTCNQCELQFANNGSLKRHMKYTCT